MKKFITEFKEFAMKGNVIDMAIGVIIGGAFSSIVSSLVQDVIMPCLSIITGKINLIELKWVIAATSKENPSGIEILYGRFLQSTMDFILTALCIFIVIRLFNVFKRKKEEETPAVVEVSSTDRLLTEIRDLLKK